MESRRVYQQKRCRPLHATPRHTLPLPHQASSSPSSASDRIRVPSPTPRQPLVFAAQERQRRKNGATTQKKTPWPANQKKWRRTLGANESPAMRCERQSQKASRDTDTRGRLLQLSHEPSATPHHVGLLPRTVRRVNGPYKCDDAIRRCLAQLASWTRGRAQTSQGAGRVVCGGRGKVADMARLRDTPKVRADHGQPARVRRWRGEDNGQCAARKAKRASDTATSTTRKASRHEVGQTARHRITTAWAGKACRCRACRPPRRSQAYLRMTYIRQPLRLQVRNKTAKRSTTAALQIHRQRSLAAEQQHTVVMGLLSHDCRQISEALSATT